MPHSSISIHFFNHLRHVSPISSSFLLLYLLQTSKKYLKVSKSKSSHKNTYSVKVLKYLSSLIFTILSELIDKTLMTSPFPSLFKQAHVTPIFKSVCQKDPNNYRPISFLPVLSKVFQKVFCVQVYRYFEYFNLFANAQIGFREGVSTSHATMNNLKFVYDNLDNGDLVLSIFLDFRKALTVWTIRFSCLNWAYTESVVLRWIGLDPT